jgi:predicted Zn-dependent protease
VRSPHASDFPYTFKVVADDTVNAFALPGGPMFIHTGLILAVDNDAQLAGVMAHEISHVALRHGTNQVSKANLIQLPGMLATQGSGGGLIGPLAKAGVGIGANSVLLKFSRAAEAQADYNGTLIMSDAGYNPIEMARFFEKLEAERGNSQSKITTWFSSHPSPGDRTRAVQDLVRQLPPQNYKSEGTELQRVQAIVARIPVPAKKPQPTH